MTLPTLDGSSREAAYLGVRLAPELTRDVKTSGAKLAVGTKAHQLLASNFRLTLRLSPQKEPRKPDTARGTRASA